MDLWLIHVLCLSFHQDRVTKRREIFQKMNVTNTGSITFDEWLDYSYKHIVGKVAQLK